MRQRQFHQDGAPPFSHSPAFGIVEPPVAVQRAQRGIAAALLGAADDTALSELGVDPGAVPAALGAGLGPDEARPLIQVWELSRLRDDQWRAPLRSMLEIPSEWCEALALEVVAYNPFLPEAALLWGRTGLRAASIFELLGLDLTPLELADGCATVCSEVADGKTTNLTSRSVTAAMLTAAFIDGAFVAGGLGGGVIQRASNAFSNYLHSVDDWVRDVTLLIGFAEILDTLHPLARSRALQWLREETQHQARDANTARVRMLRTALASMGTGTDDESEALIVPDLADLRLDAATALLQAAGFETVFKIDACPENRQDRLPLMGSRWSVRAQHPAAGTPLGQGDPLALAYSRPGERVRALQVATRLRGATAAAPSDVRASVNDQGRQ